VNAADTTINGASRPSNTWSYKYAPVVSAAGVATFITDISAAKANPSARAGQFQNVEAALYDNQNYWAADGNIEKYVSGAMSAADFKRVQAIMHGCGFETAASVRPAGLALGAQAADACSVDTYIELDRALGIKIPVQATPTYVISYKGHSLPAGSGLVSWPILKQFFDSLLSQ